MIEVKQLTKSFDDRTVLHSVDATFYTGKTNLIIGQSGSGKTVLMKSLVGLLTPDSGEILFDGRNLLGMKHQEGKELRKEIGMLFQGSALFDSETVLGNVMFPLVMFTDMSRAEMRDRAMFCTFIPNTASQADLNRILPTLIELRSAMTDTDPMRLYGYPEWTTFRGETLTNMHGVNTYVYSRFFTSPDDPWAKQVEEAFERWLRHR